MEVVVTWAEGRIPVAVLTPDGEIDASNDQVLVEVAKAVIEQEGADAILLDLSGVGYMGTAGLIALQMIVRMLPSGTPSGHHKQPALRLLNPQDQVMRALEVVGLRDYFYIYTHLDDAIADF